MERRLYIIRHAKSSWDHEDLADLERPLADRGTHNAATMAKRLMERGLIPQLLLTSPATRALHTALIMSRIWELEPEALQIHDALYEADYREIEQVLNTAPAAVCDLAIFGHNPTFTLYANQFLEERLDNLPTAGVVVVTMESDSWEGIGKAIVTDTFVDYPKRKPKDLM